MFSKEFMETNIERANAVQRALYQSEVLLHVQSNHPIKKAKSKDGTEITYMRFGSHYFAIGCNENAADWQWDRLVQSKMRKYDEENSPKTYLNKSPNDLVKSLSNMFPNKEIIKVSEDAAIPEGIIKDKIYVFCDDLFKVVSYIIVF